MERSVFNPFSKIKFTAAAAKALEVKPEELMSSQYLQSFGGKQVYAGTANPRKVAKRRAKNKVARLSRRKNHLTSR